LFIVDRPADTLSYPHWFFMSEVPKLQDQPAPESDPKAAFAHLHQSLVEYQLRFIDLSIKGTGLALLILGWVLTSKDARAFIASSLVARGAAVAGVLVMVAATILLSVRMRQVMKHLSCQLDALNYFPRQYYEYRVLSPRTMTAVSALAVAPMIVAVVLMLFGV
jgi:hypothetical protein